jgi:hypothetical protein
MKNSKQEQMFYNVAKQYVLKQDYLSGEKDEGEIELLNEEIRILSGKIKHYLFKLWKEQKIIIVWDKEEVK